MGRGSIRTILAPRYTAPEQLGGTEAATIARDNVVVTSQVLERSAADVRITRKSIRLLDGE